MKYKRNLSKALSLSAKNMAALYDEFMFCFTSIRDIDRCIEQRDFWEERYIRFKTI